MNFLFLDQAANSTAAAAAEENPWATVAMFGFWILIFVAMYFLLIRPQRKKQKEEEAMRSSIEIGDDVTTIGGIVGKVIALREDDDTFVLETGSDKTRIRFKKWAVSSIDTPEKQPKAEKKEDKKSKKDKKAKKEESEEE
ncbi:MAG: preprotein translocase subunit YajC [Clostridia bacterium]|nr:preprotein translocase subunit YajC [Clostridia bacterium]